MKILTAHVKLFRPLNLFIGAFSVFISSAILNSLYFTQELSLAILTVIFYNAGANALNDFIDQKIDQLKNSAIKNIKDASVKIAILSTSKIIQTSIDKTKLDTVFKENLEQIKNSLKKTTIA